jgi:hypothetical protein
MIMIPKKFSVCIFILISFQALSSIQGYSENLKFDPRFIPMDILAWTDCVFFFQIQDRFEGSSEIILELVFSLFGCRYHIWRFEVWMFTSAW